MKARLRVTHPTDRKHQEQYDEALRDGLSEACALAWVTLRQLGAPRLLTNERGKPDIAVDTGYWVEVKAVHKSQKDKALTNHMIRTGDIVVGDVEPFAYKLESKFNSHYAKAKRQLGHEQGQLIAFFNIDDLGIGHQIGRVLLFRDIRRWAADKERGNPTIAVIVTAFYDWRNPVVDPLG